MPSTLSKSDRRKTLRQVVAGLAIVCVVAVAATLREQTADADSDADTAGRRMCMAPSTNDIEGDIAPGHLKYYSTAKKETDDKDQYAAFLKQALPRLQGHDIDSEPDFYVTFSVYFSLNKASAKQTAAAVICKKKFSSADNECRNRSYLFFSHNEPESLADIVVDDILKSEPLVKRCPNA